MKLSDQLKQCLEERKCTNCDCYDAETVLTCKGLLQAVYEQIREYEKLEEQGRVHITDLSFGQKVYSIEDNNVIDEYEITEMSMKCGDVIYISVAKSGKYIEKDNLSVCDECAAGYEF